MVNNEREFSSLCCKSHSQRPTVFFAAFMCKKELSYSQINNGHIGPNIYIYFKILDIHFEKGNIYITTYSSNSAASDFFFFLPTPERPLHFINQHRQKDQRPEYSQTVKFT